MGIESGLFKSQDQTEGDSSQGWTLGEQHPQFWDGLGLSVPKGLGQGVANGIAMMAGGSHIDPLAPSNPVLARTGYRPGTTEIAPWQVKYNEQADALEAKARDGARALMPNPATTGTGANIVQGFTRTVGEFGTGSLAGGPLGGAAAVAGTEGYASYKDAIDNHVDPDTAKRIGMVSAVANGAGALLPMKVPESWIAALPPVAKFIAQAGAGAAINTSMGAANRASDSTILRSAGYPQMADQMKVWDEASVASDFLTGAFFGGHAGWEHLKSSMVGPAVRDAAKVVQDRQEVINRAPGVPVDPASAASHSQALESALGDLLSNKPVDVRDAQGTFARPDQDTKAQRDIIFDEFQKAGVMDDAKDFDDWLEFKGIETKRTEVPETTSEAGEPLTPESVSARMKDAQERLSEAGPEPSPEERASAIESEKARLVTPESVRDRLQEAHGDDMENVVAKRAEENVSLASGDEVRKGATADLEKATADQEQLQRTADPAAAAVSDKPNMEIPHEGEDVKAADALEEAKLVSQQVDKEADVAFTAAVNCELRH